MTTLVPAGSRDSSPSSSVVSSTPYSPVAMVITPESNNLSLKLDEAYEQRDQQEEEYALHRKTYDTLFCRVLPDVRAKALPSSDLYRVLPWWIRIAELFTEKERHIELLVLLQKMHNKICHLVQYPQFAIITSRQTILDIALSEVECVYRVLVATQQNQRWKSLVFLFDGGTYMDINRGHHINMAPKVLLDILHGADLLRQDGKPFVTSDDLNHLSVVFRDPGVFGAKIDVKELKALSENCRRIALDLAWEVELAHMRVPANGSANGRDLFTRLNGITIKGVKRRSLTDQEIGSIHVALKEISKAVSADCYDDVLLGLVMKIPPTQLDALLKLVLKIKEGIDKDNLQETSLEIVLGNLIKLFKWVFPSNDGSTKILIQTLDGLSVQAAAQSIDHGAKMRYSSCTWETVCSEYIPQICST